jgi:hypothetical protein
LKPKEQARAAHKLIIVSGGERRHGLIVYSQAKRRGEAERLLDINPHPLVRHQSKEDRLSILVTQRSVKSKSNRLASISIESQTDVNLAIAAMHIAVLYASLGVTDGASVESENFVLNSR